MKIYLDDERQTPEGWVRTYTPKETIELLKKHAGEITDLSLDHDLGDDVFIGTGYHVLIWLEQVVFYNPSYNVPNITVHSANSSAKIKMDMAIERIYRFKEGQ